MEKEALTTNDISEILGERPYRTEDYRKYLEMARSWPTYYPECEYQTKPEDSSPTSPTEPPFIEKEEFFSWGGNLFGECRSFDIEDYSYSSRMVCRRLKSYWCPSASSSIGYSRSSKYV